MEIARALYFQSGLGVIYWTECVRHAVHIMNRLPSKLLKDQTPFELLFHQPPDLSKIKAFGCLCYVETSKVGRDKFMSRSVPCVSLGNSSIHKGYEVLNLLTQEVFDTRDIKFFEDLFPLHSYNSSLFSSSTLSYIPVNSNDKLPNDNSSTTHPFSPLHQMSHMNRMSHMNQINHLSCPDKAIEFEIRLLIFKIMFAIIYPHIHMIFLVLIL